MENRNYTVVDVSDNPDYWGKDIDFVITSPTSGLTKSFEVKWDTKIGKTGNLYLELANSHSIGGCGWYEFCEAELLAYGDAMNGIFYIIPMAELREKVKRMSKDLVNCGQDSIGQLVPLSAIKDIVQVL